jgi:hypothetical protein
MPVRLDSGSKAAVKGKGILPVEVKIEAFDERVKPCSYTSRGNEGWRGSKRQKAS